MVEVIIPSKYDVVPIHTSDVGNFLRCRRYWNWASPARSNLRHRVEQYGINVPMWFGNGIHYALEMYYNPQIKRDPVEAFQTWYEYQWNGGIVTEEWLDRTYDIHPEHFTAMLPGDPLSGRGPTIDPTPFYKIQGLKDLHPSPDHDEFEAHRILGIGMMEFYKTWAPKHDTFEVVACEAMYSVPLLLPSGEILTAIDTREQSPNFGKRLEVHARGKRDTIIFDPENNQYGLIDFKTASQIGEDYFLKLENDAQVSNYMWATQMEAKMHDLPYTVISFIDYQAMWKKFPRPVTPLANGISPSLSRSDESATAEMFAQYIIDTGLTDWYENNEKAKQYYNFLVTEGDDRFINRKRAYRTQSALKTTGAELTAIAEEMLDPNLRIYKHPTGDRNCTRCVFRAPCLAMDDGSDWPEMISSGYERNKDR